MVSLIVVSVIVLAIYLVGKFSVWSDPSAPTNDARDWWPTLPPRKDGRNR